MSAIRSVWDEPRPVDAPIRVWRDWVLVAVVVGGAVIEGITRADVQGRWLELATVAVLAPTLLWRRTHPLAMVAVAFVASAAPALVLGRDLAFASNVFMLVLAYALFRWGSGRSMVLGAAVVLAKMGMNAALGFLTLADVGVGCLILGSTFALGLALRYRSGSRRRERERVVLLERERLARDLHDVVGHHISAVAVRAQAGLAVSQTDPGAAADALRVIEEQASRALAEMRTLVRVLRSDELRPEESEGRADELAPGPVLADVGRLADPAAPRVEVDLEGDPAQVSAAVGGAVQRIAQESVTNARRHARGATRIAVHVTVGETSVRLRVSDDGGAPAPASRDGYGLAGMRERAALLGGTLEAGPGALGWTVEAVLPLSTGPAPRRASPGRRAA
ncbi:sensor histidine kinase [Promicromonospora iranensis]|uniref:histidine kinase n=1 Tax=Promicromonospora iranensis TaxID=1105144 RepID=A0ABU2CH64_9MICO|nr:histidine kinase [Promicromonospora iranensis]MDR7380661.1 signal transduction histidine kinase [Promicromonospora iranensis]